jgi:IS5 family transposase
VLSVFEPHTEAIRKGKQVRATEFGQLVTIQEAEHQIITAYRRARQTTGGQDTVGARP